MDMINAVNGKLAVPPSESGRTDLGQEDFLKLMVTQFRNQDPMKPMENGEFLGQLAQFSTVSGIEEMNVSVSKLADSIHASQTVQAANMIGRTVLLEGEVGYLHEGQALEGAIDLPASTGNAQVRIFDPSGQLIRQIPMGSRQAGIANFSWDGLKSDGSQAAPGSYVVQADANFNGERERMPTLLYARVDSVSLSTDGDGARVTTESGEQVRLSNVRAIR